MKITSLTEIGANRPLCTKTIRVAAGVKSNSAKYGAALRKGRGIPIDQCGKRGDYRVDGEVRCSAHAGQEALHHILGTGKPAVPLWRTMETAPHDREIMLRLPQGGEERAIWWENWVDPDASLPPWAWRSIYNNIAGPPIRAATGWREVDET